MHHTERLKACLQRVICDPAFPLAELNAWFTPCLLYTSRCV